MANQQHKGIARIVNAIGFSWSGLKACYSNEEAFRQEVWLCLVLLPFALWLGETPGEKALLVMSLILVVITELLNSAIETVIDRVGLEWHELAGRAKDIGSAAVFIALANVIVVWVIILIQ